MRFGPNIVTLNSLLVKKKTNHVLKKFVKLWQEFGKTVVTKYLLLIMSKRQGKFIDKIFANIC